MWDNCAACVCELAGRDGGGFKINGGLCFSWLARLATTLRAPTINRACGLAQAALRQSYLHTCTLCLLAAAANNPREQTPRLAAYVNIPGTIESKTWKLLTDM